MMEHNDIFELIPAYALGALDEDDIRAVETHLAGCTMCRAELAVYEDVAGQLAQAVPQFEPPAELHAQLMTRAATPAAAVTRPVEAARPAPVELPQPDAPPRPGLGERIGGLFRTLAPIWTPVSLMLILLLLASNLLLWQQVRQLDTAPAEHLASVHLWGTDAAPEAAGYIVFEPGSQNALLVTYHLPQLSEDEQYQLWLIEDGQRDSGGVFSVRDDGSGVLEVTGAQPLPDYSTFGVTVEPAGGSPGPTGDRVLGGEL